MWGGQKMEQKTIVILFILATCVSLPLLFLITSVGVTVGSHTGYITAIEYSSIVFSDNLVYFKSDAESSQEDVYCVNDEELKKFLELLKDNKTLVTIHYKNDFIMLRSDCNKGLSIITNVT
jgi:hypothetical protein